MEDEFINYCIMGQNRLKVEVNIMQIRYTARYMEVTNSLRSKINIYIHTNLLFNEETSCLK